MFPGKLDYATPAKIEAIEKLILPPMLRLFSKEYFKNVHRRYFKRTQRSKMFRIGLGDS